jgi:hypothetical protein
MCRYTLYIYMHRTMPNEPGSLVSIERSTRRLYPERQTSARHRFVQHVVFPLQCIPKQAQQRTTILVVAAARRPTMRPSERSNAALIDQRLASYTPSRKNSVSNRRRSTGGTQTGSFLKKVSPVIATKHHTCKNIILNHEDCRVCSSDSHARCSASC